MYIWTSKKRFMKIIVDDKIPYIEGALEPFAEVVYCPGSKTSREMVKNADAIITRTRTICNERLLIGSTVKMIATATIGYDHIDTEYCDKNGIEWTNAPGCNSWSVAQYMMAALYLLAQKEGFSLAEKTIGIVGAGQVGSKIARLCSIIGMKVLINDPPRQRAEGNDGFVSLEQIAEYADIVTFHTPLTYEGIDRTFHLANHSLIEKFKKPFYLINAARGEVTDTSALKEAIRSGKIKQAIIDCWENEPDPDPELLSMAFLASPHIAGYSKDGKANGTSMSVQAISRKFNLGIDHWQCSGVELPECTEIELVGIGKTEQEIIAEAIWATYPVWEDSERLKKSPATFEQQRGDYPTRREFPVYTIKAEVVDTKILNNLEQLGFSIG
jgi:erythronate-4-phosphate dehydrogenase